MVAVVVMVLDVEVKSGEGEGQDWGITELKQASSELFSTVIMPNRSRPGDAVLALPSEGAKGSEAAGREVLERGRMLDSDSKHRRHISFM